MNDRTVQIGWSRLLGALCGLIASGLVIANFWQPHDNLGFLAVPFVAAGALLEIRSYFCRLHEAERNAFELGRDSAQDRPAVRSVR